MDLILLVLLLEMALNIVSFNCREYRMCDINNLIDETSPDILCLQETWLAKQELSNLSCTNTSYHGSGTYKIDYCNGIQSGRNSGGVAFLWKKYFDNAIEVIDFNVDWLYGICIVNNEKKVYILNVYMPYECHDNEHEFLDKLSFMYASINDFQPHATIILGDFNSNVNSNTTFSEHVIDYCNTILFFCSV